MARKTRSQKTSDSPKADQNQTNKNDKPSPQDIVIPIHTANNQSKLTCSLTSTNKSAVPLTPINTTCKNIEDNLQLICNIESGDSGGNKKKIEAKKSTNHSALQTSASTTFTEPVDHHYQLPQSESNLHRDSDISGFSIPTAAKHHQYKQLDHSQQNQLQLQHQTQQQFQQKLLGLEKSTDHQTFKLPQLHQQPKQKVPPQVELQILQLQKEQLEKKLQEQPKQQQPTHVQQQGGLFRMPLKEDNPLESYLEPQDIELANGAVNNNKDASIGPPYDLMATLLDPESAPVIAKFGDLQITPASYFKSYDAGKSLENKCIKMLVLSMRKSHSNYQVRKVNYVSGGANKRVKTFQNETYNRLFICADLTSPPNCFCIFTRTATETALLLTGLGNHIIVGSSFYVIEPKFYEGVLGEDLPVILANPSYKLLPIAHVPQLIPPQPIVEPRGIASQNWFCLHNQKIKVANVAYDTATVSCHGRNCDRAGSSLKEQDCPCEYTGFGTPSIVLEGAVVLKVPNTINPFGEAMVQSFRSLRTTEIFTKDLNQLASFNVEQLANFSYQKQNKFKLFVKYVNEVHNGWTIVGWFRRGILADTDHAGANANPVINPHISLLCPTHMHPENIKNFHLLQIYV
jgi:hypothetical protein